MGGQQPCMVDCLDNHKSAAKIRAFCQSAFISAEHVDVWSAPNDNALALPGNSASPANIWAASELRHAVSNRATDTSTVPAQGNTRHDVSNDAGATSTVPTQGSPHTATAAASGSPDIVSAFLAVANADAHAHNFAAHSRAEVSSSSVSAEVSLGTIVKPMAEASLARAVEPTPIAEPVAEAPVARVMAVASVETAEMLCSPSPASSVAGDLSHTAEALAPVQPAANKKRRLPSQHKSRNGT